MSIDTNRLLYQGTWEKALEDQIFEDPVIKTIEIFHDNGIISHAVAGYLQKSAVMQLEQGYPKLKEEIHFSIITSRKDHCAYLNGELLYSSEPRAITVIRLYPSGAKETAIKSVLDGVLIEDIQKLITSYCD